MRVSNPGVYVMAPFAAGWVGESGVV